MTLKLTLTLTVCIFVAVLVVGCTTLQKHCTSLWLEEYRCSDDGWSVEQKFENYDCTTEWIVQEECSYGCANAVCLEQVCEEKELEYDCNGDDLVVYYQYANCSFGWEIKETCKYRCIHDFCIEIDVQITDANFDAVGDDHYNLNGEWVEITNLGEYDIIIAGWKLKDEYGHTYYFPAEFVLWSHASVIVYSGTGTDGNYHPHSVLYWGRTSAVWNNDGDTAYLYDHLGSLIDTWTNR